MIACAQCKTTNTLDSVFCRRCGAALSADILVEARAELDALVTKGTQAFEDGRADDAMAIAEEAVLTDPTHANAHALKGMIHERRGEIAKALEEYERVCDLSPDSTLDRIRLSGLRSALAERATAAPDRRTPLLAGVSAAVLLACVGIAAAKMTTPAKAPVATNTPANLVASSSSTGTDPVGRDLSAVPNTTVARPATTLGQGDVPPVGSENSPVTESAAGSASRMALPRIERERSGGLSGNPNVLTPMPIPNGGIGLTLPNADGSPAYPTTTTPTTPRRSPGNEVGPTPVPITTTPIPSGGDTSKTPRRNNDGVIQIEVEKGSGNGGSSTEMNANGAEALTRVGKAHAQGGDFDRAARSFERALSAGADPATTNQRLGQAYERMGRKAEAKAAYARSADGYRKKLASGKGDDRDKNGLDSVNQAMKVLDRG